MLWLRDVATRFHSVPPNMSTDRPWFAQKKHKRAYDQHREHQDLELAEDRDDGGLAGDQIVEHGETGDGPRKRDMSGRAIRRHVLGECEVHGLGVVVEE